MKNIVIVVSILLLLGVVGFLSQLMSHSQQLNRQEFLERDAYLNKRIDSLKNLILEIKASQDTIRTDLDTLKKGQQIIYNEVKKVASKSFFDNFINF